MPFETTTSKHGLTFALFGLGAALTLGVALKTSLTRTSSPELSHAVSVSVSDDSQHFRDARDILTLGVKLRKAVEAKASEAELASLRAQFPVLQASYNQWRLPREDSADDLLKKGMVATDIDADGNFFSIPLISLNAAKR